MSGTTPFFSIVMPVYGVEKYIEKSIDSVQKQTFSDWELIAVDDKSPDQSVGIIRHAAEQRCV